MFEVEPESGVGIMTHHLWDFMALMARGLSYHGIKTHGSMWSDVDQHLIRYPISESLFYQIDMISGAQAIGSEVSRPKDRF